MSDGDKRAVQVVRAELSPNELLELRIRAMRQGVRFSVYVGQLVRLGLVTTGGDPSPGHSVKVVA